MKLNSHHQFLNDLIIDLTCIQKEINTKWSDNVSENILQIVNKWTILLWLTKCLGWRET